MSQTINAHLLAVVDGDKTTPFETDMTDVNLNERLGPALEGRYKLKCVEAEYRRSKNPDAEGIQGVNIFGVFSIAGPDGCSELGRRVFKTTPVPVGPVESKLVKGRKFMHARMVASFLSSGGKAREELENAGKLPENIPPGALEDKFCFGYITEGVSNKGNPINEVAFIVVEDYDAAPGPVAGAAEKRLASEAKAETAKALGNQGAAAGKTINPGLPVTGGQQNAVSDPLKGQETAPPPQDPPTSGNTGSDPVSSFLGGM